MTLETKDFDFRLDVIEESTGVITGYGSVFGNVDSWGDVVEKGAFLRTIEQRKIPILWQHNSDEPIGLWDEISEDDYGLKMRGHLLIDDVAKAREAYALVKSGVVNGLSIGYIPKDYFYDVENYRHISDVNLYEVSLVTFPANEKAIITDIKSDDLNIRRAEKALVDAGFSHKLAKTILAKGFKSAIVRDEQPDQRDVDIKTLNSMKELLNCFKS
jgi:hypothetical protein